MEQTDVVIIGAGPVGLFAIFQCGMLKMRCHVIDTLESIGGQCAALYPEKPIYDIPAYPAINGGDLIAKLEEQAAPFHPIYHLGERATELSKNERDWVIVTDKGTKIRSKAIIIAAGCGAFGPNRPPLAGIEEYEGKSVFYLVKKREDFRGKKVVIAGGGDSAVDWALALSDIAQSIHLIHRRGKFRAAPASIAQLEKFHQEGKIELVTPYQLHGLKGQSGVLEQVIVTTLEGQERALDADMLLPFFGLAMELGPLLHWGLNLERNHIDVNPANCATNLEGIFAIGDIATYPGKLKLILAGFSEAAMSAHSIYSLVHPNEALHFEYSTSRGVPVG